MKHKAFVSSTFEDLKAHRTAVIAALRKAGIHVDPMEDWTASSDEPKAFSQERLNGCTLCVLLVAFRRGHVPQGDAHSITQLEYQAALKSGMTILAFMLEEDEAWPHKFYELDKDPMIRPWRAELKERHGISPLRLDPTSIEIAPALTRWIAEKQGGRTDKGRFPSNVPTRGKQPFVGRDNDVADILVRLNSMPPPRAVVLTGTPGVGKSELAREYARLKSDLYPGGTFVVNCDGDGVPIDLARIGATILRIPLSDLSLEDQCLATLHSWAASRRFSSWTMRGRSRRSRNGCPQRVSRATLSLRPT